MTLRLEDLRAAMDEAATRTVSQQIATGATLYDRDRHLAPLIGDWQHMTDAEIIQRLERKLRQMQRLTAVTGHWTGDANRVIALKQALEGERRR
jgi:GGDEF domain-containing protein